MPEEAARFWSKVDRRAIAECWSWLAGKLDNGYGQFWRKPANILAHRVAYELWYGVTLPGKSSGLTLDHICRNRDCCNPTHLEIVTRGENVLRGIGPTAENARKIVCIRGHQFDGMTFQHGKYYRYCRTCANEKTKRQYRTKKQGLTPSAGGSYA